MEMFFSGNLESSFGTVFEKLLAKAQKISANGAKKFFKESFLPQHVPHEECRFFQYCRKSLVNTQKDFSFFVRPGKIKKILSLNNFSHQNVFSRHVESSCETVSEKLLPKGPKKYWRTMQKVRFKENFLPQHVLCETTSAVLKTLAKNIRKTAGNFFAQKPWLSKNVQSLEKIKLFFVFQSTIFPSNPSSEQW